MFTFFLRQMSIKLFRHIALLGISVYLVSLILISLLFRDYAMQPLWMAWGVGEVLFFFLLSWLFYSRWKQDDTKRFLRKVFFVALGIRIVYVVLMCFYFYYQTGAPFEYDAADSMSYHAKAVYLAKCLKAGYFKYIFQYLNAFTMGYSDQGYTLWLTLLYLVFGDNILIPRLFKALMSTYMCVVLFRLGTRTFGERTGKLVAVLCVFMPTFIHICGLHLKECEMIFLAVWTIERMDYVIRSKKYTFWNIAFPIILIALTFGMRTIIGITLIFAFVVFVVISDGLVNKRTKIVAVSAVAVVFFAFLFSPVGNEMRKIYRLKFTDKNYNEQKYEKLGMKHSELVKNVFMAPGAFVLPFSSMVEVSNDNQKLMNGSMFVKNLLAYFAMLAIVIAFRDKKWRNFSLIGAYELAYLFMIMFSFAANSERYHEPAIPFILLMSAYSMTRLKRKELRCYYVYCVLLVVALVGWNWLKLSSRNLY